MDHFDNFGLAVFCLGNAYLARGRTWGRYSYRTVVGPAKAGLFKEEAKESEENEEKRVCSWQWAKGKRVLSEDKIVSSQQWAGKKKSFCGRLY